MSKYYVDDDGFLVHEPSGDTIGHIVDGDHVQELLKILNAHDGLVTALRAVQYNGGVMQFIEMHDPDTRELIDEALKQEDK